MSVITKKSEKFLEAYLNNFSPTGFESPGQKMWLEYIKPYIDEYKVDNYGTVYGIVNPEAEIFIPAKVSSEVSLAGLQFIQGEGKIRNSIQNSKTSS